jgi:hypothetical protein
VTSDVLEPRTTSDELKTTDDGRRTLNREPNPERRTTNVEPT